MPAKVDELDCINFLVAAQRELMNVATSREKTKLVIIGDSKETFSEGTWLTKKMFKFIEQYGVVQMEFGRELLSGSHPTDFWLALQKACILFIGTSKLS
jgi:metallophosphoesterase superfamily enzyme